MAPRRREGELQFVWSVARRDDPIQTRWKQLERGARRIATIEEQLNGLPGRKQTDRAINDLCAHLESYFARVYELRERAVALANRILDRDIGKEAKSRKLRSALAASIPVEYQAALAPFFSILDAIDDDVKVRNNHTHHQFLTVMYGVPGDLHDPLDILFFASQHADQENFAIPLNRLLRRAVKRLSAAYAERAHTLWRNTRVLLDATRSFQ